MLFSKKLSAGATAVIWDVCMFYCMRQMSTYFIKWLIIRITVFTSYYLRKRFHLWNSGPPIVFLLCLSATITCTNVRLYCDICLVMHIRQLTNMKLLQLFARLVSISWNFLYNLSAKIWGSRQNIWVFRQMFGIKKSAISNYFELQSKWNPKESRYRKLEDYFIDCDPVYVPRKRLDFSRLTKVGDVDPAKLNFFGKPYFYSCLLLSF